MWYRKYTISFSNFVFLFWLRTNVLEKFISLWGHRLYSKSGTFFQRPFSFLLALHFVFFVSKFMEIPSSSELEKLCSQFIRFILIFKNCILFTILFHTSTVFPTLTTHTHQGCQPGLHATHLVTKPVLLNVAINPNIFLNH